MIFVMVVIGCVIALIVLNRFLEKQTQASQPHMHFQGASDSEKMDAYVPQARKKAENKPEIEEEKVELPAKKKLQEQSMQAITKQKPSVKPSKRQLRTVERKREEKVQPVKPSQWQHAIMMSEILQPPLAKRKKS